MPDRPAWVLGSSGLLGRAVVRRLRGLGREVHTSVVPWTEGGEAVETLLREAAALNGDEDVFWCAGSGVVGSTFDQLEHELSVLAGFLKVWTPGGGSFFFASSAGGVHAGSVGPPFSEGTEPIPISPYGHAKLRAERHVADFSERTGLAVLLGRISNLYGPGQDVGKQQGLVSQLCRAQLTRQPLSIYVSLDTMRDYLFVDDAATMVVSAMSAVRPLVGVHIKVLASERSTTIAAILGDLWHITRRRPSVVLGTSANARFQVRDLRLRSVAEPSTAGLARTTMAAGIAATMTSVGRQLRASTL
jgi:UDP-glucose 4-epimerase